MEVMVPQNRLAPQAAVAGEGSSLGSAPHLQQGTWICPFCAFRLVALLVLSLLNREMFYLNIILW